MKLWKFSSFLLAVSLVALFAVEALSKDEKNSKATKTAATQKEGEEKKNETTAAKGNATKGEELFEANCQMCHDAKSETVRVGPGLKGLFKSPPHKLSDGKQLAHNLDSIRHQIEKGGGAMPPMEDTLSAKDIDDVLAYLQTL